MNYKLCDPWIWKYKSPQHHFCHVKSRSVFRFRFFLGKNLSTKIWVRKRSNGGNSHTSSVQKVELPHTESNPEGVACSVWTRLARTPISFHFPPSNFANAVATIKSIFIRESRFYWFLKVNTSQCQKHYEKKPKK